MKDRDVVGFLSKVIPKKDVRIVIALHGESDTIRKLLSQSREQLSRY